ncbi:MAG: protein kinase domain-containing protein [Solirubrobacteraceae bacterium]
MSSRSVHLETGSVVGGYRIDGLLSRGGMGMVYRATNLALNRGYALKVIAPELAQDDQFRERFKREIRIAAALDHPNVVAIHYAGEHEGMLFLAMDFVDGTNLREMIARDGALAPERAVAILAQVTSALDAAHHKGLVHRDVKPANILISEKDGVEHAYLTDFGLAKRFDNATAVTSKGAVVGTVDYMPPEQITGDSTDARTDIYALGCVFFQMLTGKVPYERDNSVATLFAHVYDSPPSLVGPAAAAHPTLGPVIARAMAKSPADRYLSAGDFARDAAAALQGSRYAGPPTIVATGEARLEAIAASEPATARARVKLEAMQTAIAAEQVRQAAQSQPGPALAHHSESGAPAHSESAPPAASQATQPPTAAPVPAAALQATQPPTAAPVPAAMSNAAAEAASTPAAPTPDGSRSPVRASGRKRRWPIVAGVGLLGAALAAIVVVVVSSSGSSSGQPFAAPLNPVPTNRVTGSGRATVVLAGDVATVTVTTKGLLNAPHLMHIHAGGEGICPPASAARLHNGHLSISTTDAGRYYGKPVVSLTTIGDTSPRSIIDFTRYPVGGDIHYKRTISLPPFVVTDIRENNAVIIVHGIGYDGNGVYDGYLGTSDLSNRLTEDSTDPALCGPLVAATTVAGINSREPTVYTASLIANKVLSSPGGMSDMPGMRKVARAGRMPMPN